MSLSLSRQSNTGLFDIRLSSPMGGWSVRVMRRVPVDEPMQVAPTFVRASTYSFRFIVHPNGGNALQIVCDGCGAAYPFRFDMQRFTPCANCAVRRQSGVQVKLGEWKWQKVREV